MANATDTTDQTLLHTRAELINALLSSSSNSDDDIVSDVRPAEQTTADRTKALASAPTPTPTSSPCSTLSTPPLSSSTSDANDECKAAVAVAAAAAAAADSLSSVPIPPSLRPPHNAAAAKVPTEFNDTDACHIVRTVMVLGEAHVGKRTLFATIESLQRHSHAENEDSGAMNSDKLMEKNEEHLAECRKQTLWWSRWEHRHRCHHHHRRRQSVGDTTKHLDAFVMRSQGAQTSDNNRLCKIDLTFQVHNSQRFSVARLLESNDFDLLTNEYRQWLSASFFMILFSIYDSSSFLAALKWIDFVAALLNAEDHRHQRDAQSDGMHRAWLVGTYRTLPTRPDDNDNNDDAGQAETYECPPRAIHHTTASTVAQMRGMRYVEMDVCSFLDVEKLCQEMFSIVVKAASEKHLLTKISSIMRTASRSSLDSSLGPSETYCPPKQTVAASNALSSLSSSSSSSSLLTSLFSSVLPRSWLCMLSTSSSSSPLPTSNDKHALHSSTNSDSISNGIDSDEGDGGGSSINPRLAALNLSANDFDATADSKRQFRHHSHRRRPLPLQ